MIKSILKLKSLSIDGKKVLVRVDFNAPIKEGVVVDDSRIRATLPTLKYLMGRGAKVILMSHLGRPKNREAALSLRPVAKKLGELIGKECAFIPEVRGEAVRQKIERLQKGDLLLLENLRFEPAEEKPEKDPSFAKELARYADFYVDDAFGAAHRAHASITEVAKEMAGKVAIGFLMEEEIQHLSALFKGERPFMAVIGGAKISTKINVLDALAKEVDKLLIGGAMAYTFFKAKGISVGESPYEEEFIPEARRLLKEFPHIVLPEDILAASEFAANALTKVCPMDQGGIPSGWQGMDIGPATILNFEKLLAGAKTIFWNGPLGVCEFAPFQKGTHAIATSLAKQEGYKVVGGGDSLSAIAQMGLGSAFSFLSTGGGASLEFLEKKTLPGIEILC